MLARHKKRKIVSAPRAWPLTLIAFATSLTCTASCREFQREVEVPELIESPNRYNGKVVSVHGCYKNGVESVLLLSCINPRSNGPIWVEPYTIVEAGEKLNPKSHLRTTKTELPSANERDLQLQLAKTPNGKLVEVVLRGEFQHSDTSSFGHSPGQANRIILYRVLSAKTSPDPPMEEHQ